MPPPRKVDLLPHELRDWLREALIARGFGDYVALAEELNFKLEEAGLELRIGKSALHAFGQDFKAYAETQRAAQEEIRRLVADGDTDGHADRFWAGALAVSASGSEYQPYDYTSVPRAARDTDRDIRTTAGFGAMKGVI